MGARQYGCGVGERHVDLSGHNVLHRRSVATIGHQGNRAPVSFASKLEPHLGKNFASEIVSVKNGLEGEAEAT